MTSILQREWGSQIAARKRQEFAQQVEAVHARYRDLLRARMAEKDEAFDRARERRIELLHAQPRDHAALQAVEQEMRRLGRAAREPIDMSDLDELKQAELAELDRQLASFLEILRARALAGEIEQSEVDELETAA